jgi:exosortase
MESTSIKVAWRYPRTIWGLIGVSVILLGYGFWDGISGMLHHWGSKEEYGYAYFLPFISAYLIWQRRDRLVEVDYYPSWFGVVTILVAGFFFFSGEISTTITLVQYALVLTIVGLAYALMGWPAFKLIAGPLLLLFFIVPLPAFLYNTL